MQTDFTHVQRSEDYSQRTTEHLRSARCKSLSTLTSAETQRLELYLFNHSLALSDWE